MKLYNTLNNTLEEFTPIKNKEVKMYVCGPTVYNYIHIGNSRPLIVFDVLARYLLENGYKLTYVQNFTDIDDKIIKKSNEENISIEEVSKKYINAFLDDTSKLNLVKNVIRPTVTENIDSIIEMIQKLIDNGYAYLKGNDVLFSIRKYKDYGKLSNQDLNELKDGVRINNDNMKEDSRDFVLWKAQKENEPAFDSPFGKGRPGWHIECSAIIKKYLGDNIDIHAGGIDLVFPHHENERAQSICSTNEKTFFVKYWLHNEYIMLNNDKMSKSTGNFLTLHDALKKYDGNIIRYFTLTSHYRKRQNFNLEELEIAKKTLENISKNIVKFSKIKNSNYSLELNQIVKNFESDFKKSIEDDINTPKALASIAVCIKQTNKLISINSELNYNIVAMKIKYYVEEILGVKLMEEKNNQNEVLELLLEVRNKLRENKNYELADYIRNKLNDLNIDINDAKK